MPIEKSAEEINKEDKITLKEQVRASKYANVFVKTGGNATQAYKAINPKVKNTTAKTEGWQQLAKPCIKKAIQELLPKDEVESGVIKKALSQKTPETIKWSEKHQYLETSLKLKGYLDNKDKQGNTNIAIIIGKDLQ